MPRKLKPIIGEKFVNNQGYSGIAISFSKDRVFSNSKVIIKFESGYIGEYTIGNVRRGRFKDFGRPNSVGGYDFNKEESVGGIRFVWYNMLSRCNNPDDKDYKNYGGRGVRVCDRWHYLENFVEDIKELDGYDNMLKNPDKYTLDKDSKIEGNLLYSKETCSFETFTKQSEGRRVTVKVECIDSNGISKIFNSIAKASRHTGVNPSSIGKSLRNGKEYTLRGYTFRKVEGDLYG